MRDAKESDLDTLPAWWEDIRSSGARLGPFAPPVMDDRFRDRVEALFRDDRHRLLIVETPEGPMGLAVLCREPVSPVSDAESVQIAFLHVKGDCRGRGAGRALVAAAADYATEVGAEFVTVAALPQARDTHRFFARLGFGPVVVRRAVATSVLQRRLAGRPEQLRGLVARRRLAGRRLLERATP